MIVQTGDLFVQPHFRRIKNDLKLRLEVIFYLAEKRGRTARPPAGGKQSARWAVA